MTTEQKIIKTKVALGRWCYGTTPMQTWLDGVPLAQEKRLPWRARTRVYA